MSIQSPGFVSVVVPVRNGSATIGACIESLLNLDYPSDDREIIVVDNASTDLTGEIIARYPVRAVRETRRGLSNARNCGIEAGRGDVIAFTDADCLVTTAWLTHLARPFEEEGVSAVAGEILPYPSSTPAERYIALRKPSAIAWTAHRNHPELNFASAAVRREVFDRIGVFDPRFTCASEDIDMSWRIARSQMEVRTKPEAIVFHQNRTTPRALFKQQVGYGRELVPLAQKYPDELRWGWRDELEAWKDIAHSTWLAGKAWAVEHDPNSASHWYPYFDLVRKMGQRTGYIQGRLAAWAGENRQVNS